MSVRPLVLLLAASTLAGCTVGPDYRRPATPVAERWLEPASAGAVDLAWWNGFGDARLTALIEQAIRTAPDVAEAQARLAEARAARDAAAGGRLPSVAAKASATENVLSENGQLPIGRIPGINRELSLFDAGFDASWELDLWGRRTRQLEAARARVEAADAARQGVQLSLAAEVARNYFDLRAAQAEGEALRATADADAVTAQLTHQRAAAGESSRLDAAAADAVARASAAQLPGVATRAAGAAYRIAALLGVAPETVVPGLLAPAPLPLGPRVIEAGLRSELLQRRPDVRGAERQLAAATADVGVATADLFPRISLLGAVGLQAQRLGDLPSGDSLRAQVGPSVSWPIFSGGTIRAQIRGADARTAAALARYEKAVAGALADSEGAINRFLAAQAGEVEADAALDRQRTAQSLSNQRFARGEDDRLALMRAQRTLAQAERAQALARAERGQAAVALYKALGGGWTAD